MPRNGNPRAMSLVQRKWVPWTAFEEQCWVVEGLNRLKWRRRVLNSMLMALEVQFPAN